MPRQKRTIRHDSSHVQGEGSWVELSKLTWGEIKAMRKVVEETEGNADLQFEAGEDRIIKHVLDWNWADEDGNPLPKPQDDPSVFDDLTDEEFGFLADAMVGSAEERKN